ncbi:MAG: energy transducer TonB [Candidatus Eremiobacteraeota bacterium]|nr:energy transducer TonB [Candidatus Eremiobacteraeota bacterium]
MDNRFSKLVLISLAIHLAVLAGVVAWVSRPSTTEPAEELVLRSVELEKAKPVKPAEPELPPPSRPVRPQPRPPAAQPEPAPAPPPRRSPTGFSKPSYPQRKVEATPRATPRERPAPVAQSPQPSPPVTPAPQPAPTPAWTPPAPGPTSSSPGGGAEVVSPARPLFIPELHLRDPNKNLVTVEVIFTVRPGGEFEVRLARSTGDAELDRQALEELRKSKWRAKKVNGKEIESEVKAEVVNVP